MLTTLAPCGINLRYPELCSCHLCTSIALSEMDKQLKLVDYSDSESETEEESPAVLHGAETFFSEGLSR